MTDSRRVPILHLTPRQYRMLLLENGLRRIREHRGALAPATPKKPEAAAAAEGPHAVTYDVPAAEPQARRRCALVYVAGHGFVGAQHIAYRPSAVGRRGLGRVEMRVFVKCQRVVRPGPGAEERLRAARGWDTLTLDDPELARAVAGVERGVLRTLESDASIRALDRSARAAAGVC